MFPFCLLAKASRINAEPLLLPVSGLFDDNERSGFGFVGRISVDCFAFLKANDGAGEYSQLAATLWEYTETQFESRLD